MTEILLDNIIIELKVISKIPENGKICTVSTDNISIETTKGYQQSIKRFLYSESRERAIQKLKETVDKVSCISRNTLDSKYLSIHTTPTEHEISKHKQIVTKLKELCENIKNSLNGFNNLHTTYINDATITARLETMINTLKNIHDIINNSIISIDNK